MYAVTPLQVGHTADSNERQRGAEIEAHPTERQNKRANRRVNDAVPSHRQRLEVAVEASDP